MTMQVTLDWPDDISAALEGHWPDLPRHALEALAVEAYRTGALTEGQVRRLLRLETRIEVHSLLKEQGVPLRYTEADFEDDMAAHRALGMIRD
jgi:predicted HTH domain antitoxin